MASLKQQSIAFLKSIEGYKATDYPSGQLLDIYNAIVEAAHEKLGDDPVIQAIQPVQRDAPIDAGTLRAAMDQIRTAAPTQGPLIG
jgi:hypothetical protein